MTEKKSNICNSRNFANNDYYFFFNHISYRGTYVKFVALHFNLNTADVIIKVLLIQKGKHLHINVYLNNRKQKVLPWSSF